MGDSFNSPGCWTETILVNDPAGRPWRVKVAATAAADRREVLGWAARNMAAGRVSNWTKPAPAGFLDYRLSRYFGPKADTPFVVGG